MVRPLAPTVVQVIRHLRIRVVRIHPVVHTAVPVIVVQATAQAVIARLVATVPVHIRLVATAVAHHIRRRLIHHLVTVAVVTHLHHQSLLMVQIVVSY